MKMPNYSSRYMAIHAAADLAKYSQTTSQESPFQVGDSQFKVIRELAKIFDADNKIPNRDSLPTQPEPLMKKSTKLPRMDYSSGSTLGGGPV